MSLGALYLLFFKYGLMCFGGGLALIPMLSADLVDRLKVLGSHEFARLIAVAQITPGPIGINTATYVGFTRGGIPGAILASVGLITPAMVLVLLSMHFLKKWEKTLIVRGTLRGIRPTAYGLILVAVVLFAELSVFSRELPFDYFAGLFRGEHPVWDFYLRPIPLAIAAAVTVLQLKTKLPMPLLIVLCGIFGAFFLRP